MKAFQRVWHDRTKFESLKRIHEYKKNNTRLLTVNANHAKIGSISKLLNKIYFKEVWYASRFTRNFWKWFSWWVLLYRLSYGRGMWLSRLPIFRWLLKCGLGNQNAYIWFSTKISTHIDLRTIFIAFWYKVSTKKIKSLKFSYRVVLCNE